jgi:hypothetical protein
VVVLVVEGCRRMGGSGECRVGVEREKGRGRGVGKGERMLNVEGVVEVGSAMREKWGEGAREVEFWW